MQKSDQNPIIQKPLLFFSSILRSELESLTLQSLKTIIQPLSNIKKPNPNSTIKKSTLLNRIVKHFSKAYEKSPNAEGTKELDIDFLEGLNKSLAQKILQKYNEKFNSRPTLLNSQISRSSNSMLESHSRQQSNEKKPTNSKKRIVCLCVLMPNLKKKVSVKKNLGLITCVNKECLRVFHAGCLNFATELTMKEREMFECPYCVLEKNDPLLENIRIMLPTLLMNGAIQQRLTLDEETLNLINKEPSVGLVIKSVKLEGKVLYDQAWPDSGELFLNNKRVLEFKPLQNNSALKKRKDEKFFTREGIHSGINILKINFIRPAYHLLSSVRYNENSVFMINVILVRRLKADELIRKIQASNVRSVNDCREQIQRSLNDPEEEVSMNKVSVNLLDPFDLQTLRTPTRTRFCNHLQCFSLENLVTSMEFTVPRRWRCPICKLKAWDLIVDGYQWEILKGIELKKEKISEITFFKNGTFELVKAPENKRLRPNEIKDGMEIEGNNNMKNEDEWEMLGLGDIRKKRCLEIINLDDDERTEEKKMNKEGALSLEISNTPRPNVSNSQLKACKQKRLIPIPIEHKPIMNNLNSTNLNNLMNSTTIVQTSNINNNNNNISNINNEKNNNISNINNEKNNNNNNNNNDNNNDKNNINNNINTTIIQPITNISPIEKNNNIGQNLIKNVMNPNRDIVTIDLTDNSNNIVGNNLNNITNNGAVKNQVKMDNILQKLNKPNFANVFINCGPLYITKNRLSKLCSGVLAPTQYGNISKENNNKKTQPLIIDLDSEENIGTTIMKQKQMIVNPNPMVVMNKPPQIMINLLEEDDDIENKIKITEKIILLD